MEEKFALVRFSKKTGKVDTTLTAYGKAMLKLWGLQHTTKTKATIVLDLTNRKLVVEFVGTGDFPDVHETESEMVYGLPKNIYDILLEDF